MVQKDALLAIDLTIDLVRKIVDFKSLLIQNNHFLIVNILVLLPLLSMIDNTRYLMIL